MDKSVLQTCAVIATVIAAAWAISANINGEINSLRGDIKANSTAIKANASAIEQLREDMRELRVLLVSHIAGHNHAAIVAEAEEKQ